ncbi:hypothetical protein ACIPQJ_03060 [Streptomyces sp. NPDC090082]|uniref:hypothetical protein n=1 Tax=unclassified Streptomyces TaxID=2593676 RepID=UPI00382F15DB
MSDRPAGDQLVAALKELRIAAGGLTLGQIEKWGQAQRPPVNLGRSKLSPWFNGRAVPDSGPAFDTLIVLLEGRARQKTGRPGRGVGRWQQMRDAAAAERRLLPGDAAETTAGTKPVGGAGSGPPSGHGIGAHVTLSGRTSASDARKAQRLITLLPPDGEWMSWLSGAVTLLRVPREVSDLLWDAGEALEDDLLDYVDPALQGAHEVLAGCLAKFCDEVIGLADGPDEGRPSSETGQAGSAAERHARNRSATEARDALLRGYRELLNLLNARGLVPANAPDRGEAGAREDGEGESDIEVDLLAGRTLPDGRIEHTSVSLAGGRDRTPFSGPHYFVVKAVNRSASEVRVPRMSIELDYGGGHPVVYRLNPLGPDGRTQLPILLGGRAGGYATADATELGNGLARVARERGALPRRVRSVAETGSDERFLGRWIDLEEFWPFVMKVWRGGSEDDYDYGDVD